MPKEYSTYHERIAIFLEGVINSKNNSVSSYLEELEITNSYEKVEYVFYVFFSHRKDFPYMSETYTIFQKQEMNVKALNHTEKLFKEYVEKISA